MKNTDYNSANVYSIEEINAAAISNPTVLAEESDCHFRLEIHAAVEEILKRSEHGGVIMLSGPSSAGKTTTSMMLRHLLADKGRDAVKISLDDFFLAADETPFDKQGRRDFESIRALNLDEVRNCLLSLSETGECYMPKYDFVKKRPSDIKQHIRVAHDGFVIIEGLHAINPALTSKVVKISVTKIFLNIESSVVIDGTVFNGQTLRMLRRLVRDTSYRSINGEQCLALWDSVVDGERENILPFVGNADIVIDLTANIFYADGIRLFMSDVNNIRLVITHSLLTGMAFTTRLCLPFFTLQCHCKDTGNKLFAGVAFSIDNIRMRNLIRRNRIL